MQEKRKCSSKTPHNAKYIWRHFYKYLKKTSFFGSHWATRTSGVMLWKRTGCVFCITSSPCTYKSRDLPYKGGQTIAIIQPTPYAVKAIGSSFGGCCLYTMLTAENDLYSYSSCKKFAFGSSVKIKRERQRDFSLLSLHNILLWRHIFVHCLKYQSHSDAIICLSYKYSIWNITLSDAINYVEW